jgi:hypothetical protein
MTNFVVIIVVLNDDYHYDRGNSIAFLHLHQKLNFSPILEFAGSFEF